MAKPRYNTQQEILDALACDLISIESVRQMVYYYRRKGNTEKESLFLEALLAHKENK